MSLPEYVYVVVEREELITTNAEEQAREVYHIRYVASTHDRAAAWVNHHWEQGKHFLITDMALDSEF